MRRRTRAADASAGDRPALDRRALVAGGLAALAAASAPGVRAQGDGTGIPDPREDRGDGPTDGTSIPDAHEVAGEALGPSGGGASIFPAHRVLSYYGFPGNPYMGILGEYEPEELLARLRDQAAAYAAVDDSRPWRLAFETMASVAQAEAGDDGLYLERTDPAVIQRYIDFTAANDLLLILDCQFGRDTLANELAAVREYLRQPHVHLALDPEFMVAAGEQPGVHLGSITGALVTEAQTTVAGWARADGVPPKLLVVHQFNVYMISDKDVIAPVDGVQLVIDADGWGSPDEKRLSYDVVIAQQPIEWHGIKGFYRQDVPLMTEREVLALDPAPSLVIYQ
jgi:hypothetical protein